MTNTTISLRRAERADGAYIMELMNHEQASQRSMVADKVTLPRAIAAVKESQDPDNALDMWMVMRGKKRVGKVNSIQLGDGDVLLGFSVSPECQGKGAATEGLKQLIALLTDTPMRGQETEPAESVAPATAKQRAERTAAKQSNTSIKRLQALVEPDNMASKRVLEKNDFGLVGLIERSATLGSGANRDLFLYEIVL